MSVNAVPPEVSNSVPSGMSSVNRLSALVNTTESWTIPASSTRKTPPLSPSLPTAGVSSMEPDSPDGGEIGDSVGVGAGAKVGDGEGDCVGEGVGV